MTQILADVMKEIFLPESAVKNHKSVIGLCRGTSAFIIAHAIR